MADLDAIRDGNGELPAYRGGYPVRYVVADGGTLCAACVNGGNGSRAADALDRDCPDDDQWRIVDYDIIDRDNDEQWADVTEAIRCDHCRTIISFGREDGN